MKFSEYPYSRPDIETLCTQLEALCDKFKESKSADEQIDVINDIGKLQMEFETAAAIVYVRNTVDTRDEFYETERAFFDEREPQVTESMQKFFKALVSSPFRAQLEEKLGSVLFKDAELLIKSFSPEIIPLMQEENALCAEYQKLYGSATVEFDGQTLPLPKLGPYKLSPDRAIRKAAFEADGRFFDSHRAEFDEIFDKLVKNRTEQAHKLGLKNYVELAYLRLQRDCYTPEDVGTFRTQIIDDIVPISNKIKAEQQRRTGIDHFCYYDDGFSFIDGNATPEGTSDELLASAKTMYEELSPETAEFIDAMFADELFDVLSKEGKAPGGYCIGLPAYRRSFIFSNFNGTEGDVDVLTHEAGHAFADFIAHRTVNCFLTHSPSYDACETHSMSMEFLTAPWHHLFFGSQTAKYELFHAESALTFLPYGCMVDHFQQLMYEKPELTPEQRNEEWARLENIYRPYFDFDSLPFYSRGAGWQRQLHIYIHPFYYIDYCFAQVNALQIWVMSLADRKKAWDTYMKFVSMGGTKTFIELTKEAGLRSPIEGGAMKEISSTVAEWLDEHKI